MPKAMGTRWTGELEGWPFELVTRCLMRTRFYSSKVGISSSARKSGAATAPCLSAASLGVPIGPAITRANGDKRRLREEQALLDHLPELPDLQCAWLLLLMCARTRANHALRNIPPEDVRPYAEGRDRAVCAMLQACLGEPTAEGEPLASTAWAIAATPASGLGLQSAMRTAPAAYWGAWADTLGYWHVRQPRLASACVQTLEGGGAGRPALCAAHAAANLLRSEGWQECPTWAELGPGDWPHGWQFHASRTRSLYFRDRVLLPMHLGAGSRGTVAVPVGPTSRRVAHGYTRGQVDLAAAGGHANRSSQTPPVATPSGPPHLRPTWARMPKAVRPLGRPRPRLHTQWPFGTPREAGRASLAGCMPRGGGSPSSGCRTRRRQESRRQTADASTSWCTAPRPRASPFVAMPRWSAPSPERVPLTHERTILLASPCAWPRAASAQRIRNCSAAAASASSSLLWRSEGAGTTTRRRLSDSSSGCGLSVRRRPSELPPPVPGRVGGGACCRPQCSTLLAARRWEHRGWSPKAPLGASLP